MALYSHDARWWQRYGGVTGFKGTKISGQPTDFRDVRVLPEAAGSNSGHQAILIAGTRGHRRILLLGFDCGFGKGGTVHFHGRHPRPLYNPTEANFSRWREQFDPLARDLATRGIDVINCSRADGADLF
jgi:hypothetical protein